MGLVLAVLAGCGRQAVSDSTRARVSGHVRFAGHPLKGGSITLVLDRDAKYRITGMIQPDGSYAFDGAPVGPTRVTVETESLRYANPAGYVPIPARYGRLESSGLAYDVQPNENKDVNFELGEK